MLSFEAVLRTCVVRSAARLRPGIGYCLFDRHYLDYEHIGDVSLEERRKPLEKLVGLADARNIIEFGPVIGVGNALFAEASECDLEEVVAKRRDSVYQPETNTGAWTKFKKRVYDHAAALGYLPEEGSSATDDPFRSRVVAIYRDGKLSCAGRVGSRFGALRAQVGALLRSYLKWFWVESGIYCLVSDVELTSAEVIRAGVFKHLIEEADS